MQHRHTAIPFSFFFSVDATKESPHVGRLINHSRGGANSKPDVGGRPVIYFNATRALSSGEELLYDYGERRAALLFG